MTSPGGTISSCTLTLGLYNDSLHQKKVKINSTTQTDARRPGLTQVLNKCPTCARMLLSNKDLGCVKGQVRLRSPPVWASVAHV